MGEIKRCCRSAKSTTTRHEKTRKSIADRSAIVDVLKTVSIALIGVLLFTYVFFRAVLQTSYNHYPISEEEIVQVE